MTQSFISLIHVFPLVSPSVCLCLYFHLDVACCRRIKTSDSKPPQSSSYSFRFPSLLHRTIIYLVTEAKISEVFLHLSTSLTPGKSNEAPGYADFNSQVSPQSISSFQPHHHYLHSAPHHGIPKLPPPFLLLSTAPI